MTRLAIALPGAPRLSRRIVMLGATGTATALFSPNIARAMTEVNFVEAVHNLGYINLYVGQGHSVLIMPCREPVAD